MSNPSKSFRNSLPFLVMILASVSTACGHAKLAKPTRTLSPTGSTAASTPTPVRTILYTYTPKPTSTTIPTELIHQATLEAAMTSTPLPIHCEPNEPLGSSPGGQCTLEDCSRGTEIYPEYLQVLNNSDGRQWRVGFDLGKSDEKGMLFPALWTKDGVYLFLEEYGAADGPMTEFWGGSGLLRLNLVTGETVEILPIGYYAIAFSSNGRLAYVYRGYQPPQFMNILNLSTGEEQRFSLGSTYCSIGHLLWSPQEDRIIYTAATCVQYPYIESLYSYMILDLNSGDYHTFYSSEKVLPRPLKWEGDYPLFSSAMYSDTDQPACWVLNLDGGVLLPSPCP
jgi:hypothetical protein